MNHTSATTRDIVHQYFSALAQRDLDKILPLLAEAIDWYVPGDENLAPWLGQRNSKAEVADFFRLLWQSTEAISGELSHMLVDGNVALTSGNFSSKMLQTGVVFHSLFFTEITVENGLIVRYRLLEDSLGLVHALS